MPTTIEARLDALGLELPLPAQPVANFVPCVQSGSTLFVSGQISSWNGSLRYVGKVGKEISLEEAQAAARLCALNLVAQIKAFLGRPTAPLTCWWTSSAIPPGSTRALRWGRDRSHSTWRWKQPQCSR